MSITIEGSTSDNDDLFLIKSEESPWLNPEQCEEVVMRIKEMGDLMKEYISGG